MPSEKTSSANSQLLQCAQACRILGALFYWPPNNPNVLPILDALEAGVFSQQWALEKTDKTVDAISMMESELRKPNSKAALAQEYQHLFIGPENLQAPPWGSVYLEQEGTLFGETTQALHTFLMSEGIALDTGQEEPEDHIGLMLWEVSLLAEDLRKDAVKIIVHRHLLTWANNYLEKLSAATKNNFYRGLAMLTNEALTSIENAIEDNA